MNVRPFLFGVGISAVLALACTQNPSIDGTTVAKIGSPGNPPSCADVCTRLVKLCGMAPQDCTLADAGGYCDQSFDYEHRLCVGQAPNCSEATACSNAVPDAAPVDAGSDDAATEAAPSDASDASSDASKE